VAAINRSSKAKLTPCSACWPSIWPASLAVSTVYRMHRHVADEFVDEGLAALPPLLQLGELNPMRQFHHGNHRNSDLGLSVASFEIFEDFPYGVAPPLSGDDHAGIED